MASPNPANFPKRVWRVLFRAIRLFNKTDGEQRAASFAYYAFFSLFPLLLLLVSLGSLFVSQQRAVHSVIDFASGYFPVSATITDRIADTITGVMKTRGSASIIALLGVAWSSLRFFQALVRGVNQAWGTHEYSWWRLPLKNLGMVGILASVLLIGVLVPAVMDAMEHTRRWNELERYDFGLISGIFSLLRMGLPTLMLLYGFLMFYKFAPRRKTQFSEVWVAALTTVISLQVVQWLFVIYARHFYSVNAIYGAFGSVVALLVWIYLSGSIIIFGGCLSAANAQIARRDRRKTGKTARRIDEFLKSRSREDGD